MTRGVRILIGSALLVPLLVAGGLWLSADRLLDKVARPWLTARAAVALDAEVQLERLAYVEGWLRLTGLSLAKPGELRLEVAAIDVNFSWTGLLQRRLDELVIHEPQLSWTASAQEPAKEPVLWSQEPPLDIGAWSVENGRVELAWGARTFLFDRLAAEGGLGRQFPFVLSALFGTAPATPLQLAGDASWQDGPAITLAELSWGGRNLLAQPVTLAPGPDQTLGVQLSLARLDDAELAGLLTSLGEPLPWPAELHWQLTSPALDLLLRGNRLDASLQTGAGLLQTAEQDWPWLDMTLTLQGDAQRLELVGHLGMAGATTLDLTGSWADQHLNGNWSVTAANPAALLQSVGMSMPVTSFVPSDLQVQGQIEAGLDAAWISKAQLAIRLDGLGTLAGDVHGEWRDQQLSLGSERLNLTSPDGTRLAEAAVSLAGAPAEADWHGDWSLRVADVERLAGQGGFPLPDGLPALQELSVKGRLSIKDNRLSLPDIDLAGQVSGAGLSGSLQGRLALQTAPDIDLAVLLEALTVDHLEYQAEDGMAGLTGGRLDISGRLQLAGQLLRFDLSGRAAATEALIDSWYGNLQELPARFAVKGDWSSDQQRLELTSAEVELSSLVSGRFTGSYADGATSLNGQVEVPQMQGAFQKTLQTLTGELLPDIKQIALDGRLILDGGVRYRPGNWELDLAILPSGVTLAWGQQARIEGLHGRLPIHLRQNPPITNEQVEQATLQWSRLQGSLLDSGPGRLELQSSTNSWQLRQPFALAVAGGTLQLTAMQLDLAGLVPRLKASFEVQNVELRQITRSLGWPEMSGRLNAHLQEVRIAADEISTVGDAAMQLFGGAFSVNNMRVEAPFSRFPTYHADLDFTGIDLYPLTNTFEFGEMNGIADGYIHNLRLFDGTPSALQAKLETRTEGTRNISVKAIRNLNTLSMGGLSAALSQGIYQFIDFYRYRKIGIVCRLHNDLFYLEGTAREGSDQYLIYGGLLPPRIDVVVSSPTVSFKEMVSRLKRIERTDH